MGYINNFYIEATEINDEKRIHFLRFYLKLINKINYDILNIQHNFSQ